MCIRDSYRPQLAAYRAAVQTMLGLGSDRIATRLVFVQTGQVVQVDSPDQTIDGDTDLKLPRKAKKKKPTKKKSMKNKVKPPKTVTKRPKKDAAEVQQTFWTDED